MITSSGRIVLAPAGGEDKRAKQEISLLAPECSWKTQVDVKGQTVWCVNTDKSHYTFEDPKSSAGTSSELGGLSADDWIEALVRARELALSQNSAPSYAADSGFGDMSSTMSSPASTLGGRGPYGDGYSGGTSERSGRNHLSKSQASLEDPTPKRNRFSKRQSKSGLGAQF
ncbi:hypothetical protein VD0004_g3946 [Verticillium dahliae]|nr:hypothetical protein VD0004_g3946 [Verticillium dahliae]